MSLAQLIHESSPATGELSGPFATLPTASYQAISAECASHLPERMELGYTPDGFIGDPRDRGRPDADSNGCGVVSYLQIGREKNLIAEQISLAKMHAVVAVPKGNPLGIASLADLFKPEVRLVQSNPEAAAIRKITRAMLQPTGQWELRDKATTAYPTTVNDVVVGAADAGIVYAVLHEHPQLEAVAIAELESAVSPIAIGVISSSKQPAIALHFARFVAARDRGLAHYTGHGFQVTTGDEWADN